MALNPQELSAATKTILDHQRILVVPHANVDPDCLGSALACYQMFKALGKDVTVICPDTPPESLRFLPAFENFRGDIEEADNFVITVNLEDGVEIDKLRYTVEDNKVNIIVIPKSGKIRKNQIAFGEGDKPYDLIVVVDTADTALLGSVYSEHVDLFSGIPVLNVDHHISNTRYGQMHLIDPTAASATEVLYNWFMSEPAWSTHITPDMATLLLTGLITDTRSFQNPNTTPRSLEVAAELLEKGARQQEIIQHIYKTKPLSTLKIWGRALNRIQMDAVAGIVWSAVSHEDLQEMGATSKETHGILDELISTIPNADIHVLFTEMEDGSQVKGSMRSSAAIDCSRLAAECFGGGGHPRASGFRIKGGGNFQLAVLEGVKKLIEGMKRQRDAGEEIGDRSQEIGKKTQEKIQKPESKDQKSGTAPVATDSSLLAPGSSTDIVQTLTPKAEGQGSTDIVGGLMK